MSNLSKILIEISEIEFLGLAAIVTGFFVERSLSSVEPKKKKKKSKKRKQHLQECEE